MSVSESKPKRRLWIIINHILLLATLISAFAGETAGWGIWIKICFWLSVAAGLAVFYSLHFRTGLWRLAHAKADTLDEREIQLTLGALRYAYGLFSVIALLTILAMVVFGFGSQILRLVIFWVLLYLAHTLPSSVIAWTENRVCEN